MKKYIRIGALAAVVLGLSGCETTGPQVSDAVPPGTLACRVGPDSATRTVPVQVWRGRESGLSGYNTQRVCQQLEQVSRQLHAQGASVRFEVMGSVQIHPSLGRANNPAMQTAVALENGHLGLVVVDAIEACGGTVGYILGCTPRIGRPLVFLKQHERFNDRAPEWVIWAHEMGHTVGLLHPDDPFSSTTYTDRIMTYMPLPQSERLESPERPPFASLGWSVSSSGSGSRVGAAVGAAPEKQLAPHELVPFVLNAGQHGLPLQPLVHLDDDALLTLRVLLEPVAMSDSAWLARISQAVRINALVPVAELGRDQAQAYVRDYLVRQTGSANQSLRRYGLWALGRGQLRHPTDATRVFLQQASQAAFWCAKQEKKEKKDEDCAGLASAAQEALRDISSKPQGKP
jgi:hypothetical protein